MISTVTDTNIVGELDATIFTATQAGPTGMLVVLENSGLNTLNYFFQEFDGTNWVDLDTLGTDLNNTLTAATIYAPGETKNIKLTSTYAQVRLRAYAAGGAELRFSVTRPSTRAPGGQLPLLSF